MSIGRSADLLSNTGEPPVGRRQARLSSEFDKCGVVGARAADTTTSSSSW